MSEKFDDFKKNKKEEFTDQEYEAVFFDEFLNSMMILYEHFKKDKPDFAKYLEYDYNQFINEIVNYFYTNKTLNGSLKYIISKNPNNLWIDVIEVIGLLGIVESINNPEEKKEYQKIDQRLKELIIKRRNKKDIQ
ncbi:MAG: hypothetical protein NZ484_00715 [Patescibacteria group bacterium]|nr:hypothetical protein [Patescibacteria group bacterium]MDW8279745.1 hypothetical protein [bacterium]